MLYEKGDYNRIKDALNEINWEKEYEKYPDNIEQQWQFFKESLKEAEANFIPRKNVFINGKFNKKFSVPLDKANLKKLKRKNRLWSKVRKDLASDEQNLQYNRLRNQIRRLTRKGKKLLEKTIAANSKSNPKAFWKYASEKFKTNTSIPDLLINENDTHPTYADTDESKSEVLLDYFSSVFTLEPDSDNMPFFEKREFKQELDNLIITDDMVFKKYKD